MLLGMISGDRFLGAAKGWAKRLAYESGALGVYHRRRNRAGLTVLMFHRVLAQRDPRWPFCNQEWTLTDRHFAECIRFVKDHYSVIGVDQLLEADFQQDRLPERPVMISFDDGWSDNEEYALEVLATEGVPASLFVVSNTIGKPAPFWKERLYGGWRTARLAQPELERLWRESGEDGASPPTSWGAESSLNELMTRLIIMDVDARDRLLGTLPTDLIPLDRPYMASDEQLIHLAEVGVEIGSHGRTHEPVDQVLDLRDEIVGSRQQLHDRLQPQHPALDVRTLSFPQGRYPNEAIALARETGYKLLLTSHELVNEARNGRYSWILGRCNVATQDLSDESGRFRPDLLALHLFRSEYGYVDEQSQGLVGDDTHAY